MISPNALTALAASRYVNQALTVLSSAITGLTGLNAQIAANVRTFVIIMPLNFMATGKRAMRSLQKF
jgi:hypothetical protein